MDYGKALRTVRAARGLSQKGFAQLVGLDASYISLIESGSRVPSAANLEAFAEKLGIPLYLFILLGGGEQEVKGLSKAERDQMGGLLLEILVGTD